LDHAANLNDRGSQEQARMQVKSEADPKSEKDGHPKRHPHNPPMSAVDSRTIKKRRIARAPALMITEGLLLYLPTQPFIKLAGRHRSAAVTLRILLLPAIALPE